MENTQIADMFDEIAGLLELQKGDQFRIRAYRSASRSIRDLSQRIEDYVRSGKKLTDIPHVGESTAEKILDILQTGTTKRLEELRAQVPKEVTDLMRIPYLGPRKAMQIHQELGVNTLDGLRRACEEHRVRGLRGMGEKSEQKILEGLQTLAATSGRFHYRDAAEFVASLGHYLDKIPAIRQWKAAGSFRRCRETIGDLDILVEAKDREDATGRILKYPAIKEVVSRGPERVTVRLDSGLQVDFRFFEPKSFGAALMYFTGSKQHSIALRTRARQHDWKLNEYGLFAGNKLLAGKTEEDLYGQFRMQWIPPELREDRGELDAATKHRLPKLIEPGDIRGDLHCHTTVTDGNNSLEEMVQAARDRGYVYLAITEHSKAVTVARGLDGAALRRNAGRIRKYGESLKGLWLLPGVEVDILKSGKLDIEEKVLAELDWVVASVHSYFDLKEPEMTGRIVAAVSTGVVHCLGHPLGRLIGKRNPISFDVDKVFAACAEHHVCIEINAQPERLDLPDTYCQQALAAGLSFVITTDAHSLSNFDFMPLGVNVARRGWLEKGNVLNTLTPAQLRKRIQRR